MITVLHSVALAKRCFLSELLYWVALRRLPLAIDDSEGGEFRFSAEQALYAASAINPVSYSECEFAGLPPNPHYRIFWEEGIVSDAKFLKEMKDDIEALSGTDREDLITRRQNAIASIKEIVGWNTEFSEYLDYFKSKLFVDLREGKIIASGIALNAKNSTEIDGLIETTDLRLDEMNDVNIAQQRWVYSKIDWDNSILYGSSGSFCWVSVEVDAMLTVYPLPDLPVVGTIKKLCDAYVLENRDSDDVPSGSRRGRPPLPWELFHVEVAVRAKEGTLPDKKEAAISELCAWFRDKHGVEASRTSIGQKLTPYYRTFFRADVKNNN